MQNKKVQPIFCAFCLLLNLLLPLFEFKVYATSKNEVTLNFIGGTIQEEKVFYVDDSNNCTSKISLVSKNSQENSYTDCPITGNGMKIDLNEKEYYLKVVSSSSVENPDEILGIAGGSNFNRLYINDTSFDITSNPYVGLHPDSFIGPLNIKLEKEPSPPSSNYPDDISIRATYNGFGMEILFNSEKVGSESQTIIGTAKGYATGDIYNLICIQLAFGDGNIGSVTVNDKTIPIPEGTKDHLEFTIAPASKYIINVKKSQNDSNISRTIIWASDKKDNTSLKDDELLKNGIIEILDIKDPSGNSIGLGKVKQDTEKNNGMAEILPGSKVIMRLKPDYGYQLASIKINDETLIAIEKESIFEYTMPDTNVHLSGIFEKVDNNVKSTSNKVKNGTITLGGSEIESGSVLLSVDDAELSKEQMSNFEENAKGYDILSYLNIRLDQIIYKGTPDDFWSKELKELNNQATITLSLENGINGNEVVIVHEKDDGSYELIPTSYDPSSNTITFKTSSFSNYAIASKQQMAGNQNFNSENKNKNSNNTPQTGDDIIKYVLLVTLSLIGLALLIIFSRINRGKIKNNKENL